MDGEGAVLARQRRGVGGRRHRDQRDGSRPSLSNLLVKGRQYSSAEEHCVADPRLRDEALDWCIDNWRYVSRVRLRNLLAEQPPELREEWGPFAATVSKHAGIRWPGATKEFRYTTTGRSSLESMAEPSRAWLRMRAMFGLGARTEILRYFLSGHRRATLATIARRVRYAKRNVADECESLVKAGVLRT